MARGQPRNRPTAKDKKDILMGMSFSFVGAEGFEPPTLCL